MTEVNKMLQSQAKTSSQRHEERWSGFVVDPKINQEVTKAFKYIMEKTPRGIGTLNH